MNLPPFEEVQAMARHWNDQLKQLDLDLAEMQASGLEEMIDLSAGKIYWHNEGYPKVEASCQVACSFSAEDKEVTMGWRNLAIPLKGRPNALTAYPEVEAVQNRQVANILAMLVARDSGSRYMLHYSSAKNHFFYLLGPLHFSLPGQRLSLQSPAPVVIRTLRELHAIVAAQMERPRGAARHFARGARDMQAEATGQSRDTNFEEPLRQTADILRQLAGHLRRHDWLLFSTLGTHSRQHLLDRLEEELARWKALNAESIGLDDGPGDEADQRAIDR